MKKIICSILIALCVIVFIICGTVIGVFVANRDNNTEDIKITESGGNRTFAFSEEVATISNPGVGYTAPNI